MKGPQKLGLNLLCTHFKAANENSPLTIKCHDCNSPFAVQIFLSEECHPVNCYILSCVFCFSFPITVKNDKDFACLALTTVLALPGNIFSPAGPRRGHSYVLSCTSKFYTIRVLHL